MPNEISLLAAFMLLNCWFIYMSLIRPGNHHLEMQILSSRNRNVGNLSLSSGGGAGTGPSTVSDSSGCQILKGRWVRDDAPPLYTNETCGFIQANHDCFKNGRPDRDFLRWRWKPDDCELPRLDPAGFLRLMRGKKLVLLGDSIARNHMQSLLCALAQVEEPQNLEPATQSMQGGKWSFQDHNFTLTHLWAPFLVEHEFINETYHVHLDVPDDSWAEALKDYQVAVISTGYWFFRPSIYYLNSTIIGCNPRSGLNFTRIEVRHAYRLAHRHILRHMLQRFDGITLLRTVTVDHFEHGSWNTGGLCNRTGPYSESDAPELPWMSNEMNTIQVQEFEGAVQNSGIHEASWKLNLLDVTRSAFMRPDGHPNTYRFQPPFERPQNDCLHWCLPGPIDMWNQLIWDILRKKLHILKNRGTGLRHRQFSKLGLSRIHSL